MKPNSQSAARMNPKPATARQKFLRRLAPVLVALFATLSSVGHADVVFPSMPMQTGVAQPAPNIIFILDDSLSMTTSPGDVMDTRLEWCTSNQTCPNSPDLGSGAGAPYTKNALSYNPATTYHPWATANTNNTDFVRRADASYTSVSTDPALLTGSRNLNNNNPIYYVPKPSATNLSDRRQYYRYEIRGGSSIVRSEYGAVAAQNSQIVQIDGSNVDTGTLNSDATVNNNTANVAAGKSLSILIENTSTGSGNRRLRYQVYSPSGARVCGTNEGTSVSAGSSDTCSIDSTVAGSYQIRVWRRDSNAISYRLSASTHDGYNSCGNETSGSAWINCTDVSSGDAASGVRMLAAEKQNYANWYHYYRTRMKAAKAGGSEAFASLDKNYRLGVMGLYPVTEGGYGPQILGGSIANIIPTDNNFGLFEGSNRKNWFDHLQGMQGNGYTPLRQALAAAGEYYRTDNAYRASGIGPDGQTAQTSYLACRQNFAILTTDGYWNKGTTNASSAGIDPDSDYGYLSGDDKSGTRIYLPGRDGSTDPADYYQYQRLPPYWYSGTGDYNDSTTLADVAMHYWKTDLRPRVGGNNNQDGSENARTRNVVPTSASNPAFWQHMVTFGVGLGVQGQLNDAQVVAATTGQTGGFWPTPSRTAEVGANIDDLRHAALNGRGAYVNANNAQEFTDGIKNALTQISARRGSASNVLANSTSFSAGSRIYQATYTSGSWTGQLLSRVATSAGVTTQEWEASEVLPDADSRNIIANDGTNVGAFPTAAQSGALGTAAASLFPTADPVVNGAVLGNYLRGVQSREVQNNNPTPARPLRARGGLLGDIVNSSPVYVVDVGSIFVGANDGMLHGFAADTGVETFAYVPKGVNPARLAELAHPDYGINDTTNPHRYFVDGPVVVSHRTQTPGSNYLVGALGRGGWGLFGLDVTNPSAFDAGDVLWDHSSSTPITSGDYVNMGQVVGDPLVVTLNNGVKAALVANGVNSSSGAASMFVVNLQTGAVIKEFVVENTSGDNGLFAVRGANLDGGALPNLTVDHAYAGDLQGNIWKFDLSSSNPANWKHIKLVSAVGPDGAQAITGGLALARHPFNDTDGDGQNDVWVFFGTGRFLTEDDRSSVDVQSIYGIRDTGNFGSTGFNADAYATTALYTRSDLDEKDIVASGSANGRYVRSFESYQANVPADKQGWYLDLGVPTAGERVVVNPQLDGTVLNVVSIVPPNDANTNSCEAGGIGYVNALNPWSGTGTEQPYLGVNQPANTFTDADGNTHQIDSVRVDEGMPSAPVMIGDTMFLNTSSAEIVKIDVNPPTGGQARRISWRELLRN